MTADPAPAPTTTVVVMGVSGCGKTTVAHELVRRLAWRFAEGDDFHPATNVEKMRSSRPLDDEDRWPWLRSIAAWIGEQEETGQCAVVTCSALRRPYRDLLRDGHRSVWFAHLTTGPEELLQRLGRRHRHFMSPVLLSSQLAALQPLDADEPGATLPGDVPPADVAARLLRLLDERCTQPERPRDT